MCSSTVSVGTTASFTGSSGTSTAPAVIPAVGPPRPSSWPLTRTVPADVGRAPTATSHSSRCPLPATPATPTISPGWTVRVTSCSAVTPRSPSALTPTSSSAGGASEATVGRSAGRGATVCPTIASTSSASVIGFGSTPPSTTRPPRSTVTRSAMARTSASLWVTITTPKPCAFRPFTIANSASTSDGASTLVGSSRMTIRAPVISTLRISVR